MILPRSLSCFGTIAALVAATQAAYTIQDTYDTDTFFDGFEFFNEDDPTHGFVKYHTAATANLSSLAGYADGGVYLGTDFATAGLDPNGMGRGSTRVNSKKTYTKGLFIADIAHMPTSSKKGCGLWPAFWTTGTAGKWPSSGEIDIIEGVNSDTSTKVTLHTSAGCSFSQGDCNKNTGHDGCTQNVSDTQTFGPGFNAIGGGVYAVEWTSNAITTWFFPRTNIPADISAGNPDPNSWAAPIGTFSGSGCNIDQHFQSHQIVFNTDFCGDWAGNNWASYDYCTSLAPTCAEYVAANPGDFQEAYWLINTVKVYSNPASSNSTTNSTLSSREATMPRLFKA